MYILTKLLQVITVYVCTYIIYIDFDYTTLNTYVNMGNLDSKHIYIRMCTVAEMSLLVKPL